MSRCFPDKYALLIVLIVLFGVARCFSGSGGEWLAPYAEGEDVPVSAPLSAQDINAFIDTWKKYSQENADKDALKARNQSIEISPEDDPALSAWLTSRGWKPARFFYIEERLRAILATISRDEQILRRHKMILDRMAVEADKTIVIALKRVADRELQRLNIERISSHERQLAEPRLPEIRNLFGED